MRIALQIGVAMPSFWLQPGPEKLAFALTGGFGLLETGEGWAEWCST